MTLASPSLSPSRIRARIARALLSTSLTAALLSGGASPAVAVELVVTVSGNDLPSGQVGCALYPGEAGFPMDPSQARMIWLAWQAPGVTCRFTNVPEGRYAVSVMLDQNGNRKVDTNFLGMPKEAWGVSNNARPTFRPPRFDEAVISVKGAVTEIEIGLAR